MRRALVLVVFAAGLACSASPAQKEDPAALSAPDARVYRSSAGKPLTAASSAAPAAIARTFLRDHGAAAATLASLRDAGQHPGASGVTHVRLEQEVGGLRVLDGSVKAAVSARGELLAVIDASAVVDGNGVEAPRATEGDALQAAMALIHPGVSASLRETGRSGNVVSYERTSFFHSAPTVERIAIPTKNGVVRAGFLVETWTAQDNLLHHAVVSGAGKVLGVELRTNDDRYNVFPEDPDKTPQQIVNGPGSGNEWSPAGWLLGGPQKTIDIAGYNVHAYLDAVPDNAPDAGGDPVGNGDFLTAADLTVTPQTAGNRAVAVQNLFYLNNVIHDTLYRAGFTETTANFQNDNFGRDPHGPDAVNAEAQDGGGTDNANFATPQDGKPPRMQMYLWTGKGNNQVVVTSPASIAGTYRAQGAAFGGTLDATGITGSIVLVNDGAGSPTDACEALPAASLAGAIALMDRGTCAFVVKVKNVQNAGALAAVVANNAGDSIITMGGADPTITIPAVFISRSDGTTIKNAFPGAVAGTVRKTDPAPLQRDGDIDSDVVWHEYGHGLTWRMIGHMAGPIAGAVGEGMSDVLAILMNGDDVVGEYAFDDPLGIRRARYHNYAVATYGIRSNEVHNDGEVYGAIGWRLWELYDAAGIARDELLATLVDGMNYTKSGPAFEDMRDGILSSIAASSHPERECLVWSAFARYGVGVNARGIAPVGYQDYYAPSFIPPQQTIIVQDFSVPRACR